MESTAVAVDSRISATNHLALRLVEMKDELLKTVFISVTTPAWWEIGQQRFNALKKSSQRWHLNQMVDATTVSEREESSCAFIAFFCQHSMFDIFSLSAMRLIGNRFNQQNLDAAKQAEMIALEMLETARQILILLRQPTQGAEI